MCGTSASMNIRRLKTENLLFMTLASLSRYAISDECESFIKRYRDEKSTKKDEKSSTNYFHRHTIFFHSQKPENSNEISFSRKDFMREAKNNHFYYFSIFSTDRAFDFPFPRFNSRVNVWLISQAKIYGCQFSPHVRCSAWHRAKNQ